MSIHISGGREVDSFGPFDVTFPAGSTSASFDGAANGFDDEIITSSIISITNGHMVGTPAVATLTIIGKLLVLYCTCIHTYIHNCGTAHLQGNKYMRVTLEELTSNSHVSCIQLPSDWHATRVIS